MSSIAHLQREENVKMKKIKGLQKSFVIIFIIFLFIIVFFTKSNAWNTINNVYTMHIGNFGVPFPALFNPFINFGSIYGFPQFPLLLPRIFPLGPTLCRSGMALPLIPIIPLLGSPTGITIKAPAIALNPLVVL